MNQEILKRLDTAIEGTLLGNCEDPDCNVGAAICVLHKGGEIYRKEYGEADKEKKIPMRKDTIFRCYSMTKPITSVAVMTLVESGKLSLSDTASMYLPGFQNQKVYTKDGLVPVKTEVTIQHLLDMTAGVVYPDGSYEVGKIMQDMIDEYYRKIFEEDTPTSTYDLANQIGEMPLEFQPGEGWRYSFCADVLGAIIEVVTGMKFGEYLKKTIFDPLGMTDTDFYVPEDKVDRLMQNYQYMPETKTLEPCTWQHLGLSYMHLRKPAFESGGAGLVSTIDDYEKFVKMMMNKGSYGDVRILGRKTVEWMTQNHLDEKQLKWYDWDALKGYGYGNLMRVMIHEEAAESLGSNGEYGWDGWLGCYMFIDPKEELAIIYVIQKCGGNGYRDVQAIRNIVYSAL